MNQKLLEQLALAKQAGTKAMAKDFFSKPENPAEAPPEESEMPAEGMPPEGGEMPEGGGGGGEPSEEELQELLSLLGNQG